MPSAMSATRLPTSAPLTITPRGAGKGQTVTANVSAASGSTQPTIRRVVGFGSTRSSVAVILLGPPFGLFAWVVLLLVELLVFAGRGAYVRGRSNRRRARRGVGV